jgi:hypothetical protein
MASDRERAHHSSTKRTAESVGGGNMALVHHHEPDRARDLSLCGLALVVLAIIVAAVPFLKFCVDGLFALFQ